MLAGALQRLAGGGGDPVAQLQTNFGGGKTHSMLALYHLCAGLPPGELAGIDALLREVDTPTLPNGAPDEVVRTVTENSRTLKLNTHGFERE